MAGKRVLHPLAAHDEAHRVAVLPEEPPGGSLGGGIGAVDRDDPRACGDGRREPSPRVLRQRLEVEERAREVGLRGKVAEEIGLRHRRDRMAGHDGVPVESEDAIGRAREEMPEYLVAPHRGCCGQERDGLCRADPESDLDGTADAADMRGGIEGRTDLVVQDRGAARLQPAEEQGQFRLHPVGPAAPRGGGDSDAANAREACGKRRVGDAGEEDRWQTREGQNLHHGRRAGKVVAKPCNARRALRWYHAAVP